jgi:hypothetical protein
MYYLNAYRKKDKLFKTYQKNTKIIENIFEIHISRMLRTSIVS